MNCGSCSQPSITERLDAQLNATVEIDYCLVCQAFWFDKYESLQLRPRAVLKLFKLIGEATARGRTGKWPHTVCPRCNIRLLRTHDLQRSTPFEYWRCPHEHGRLISFYDFLREKDFIKAMTAAEVNELKKRVESIACSNCGAPIDLSRQSSCEHCGSPLSLLDVHRAETLIAQLQKADLPFKGEEPSFERPEPVQHRSELKRIVKALRMFTSGMR